MANYEVSTTAGGGSVSVDRADSTDMGARGSDASQRELAISYARTMYAQTVRKGYEDVAVTVRMPRFPEAGDIFTLPEA